MRSDRGSGELASGAAYLESFASLASQPARRGPDWLVPVRKAAIGSFEAMGFPSTRDEEWRFTSVAPIERVSFRSAPASQPAAPDGSLLEKGTFGLEEGWRLVFVNGRWSPALSSGRPLPPGVTLSPLAAALGVDPAIPEHLARHAPIDDRAFTALNTALFEDGAFIRLADRVVLDQPILLVFLTTPEEEPRVCHPRILVLGGEGSQATIIESYAGPDDAVYFTNTVTEIVAGPGAVLRHYKLQREGNHAFHVASIQAALAHQSGLTSHSVSLGGGLVRNDIDIVLGGEGAECSLDGLYVVSGRQHVDNHTTIDHARPHGTSREIYKGILDGDSRGVFDGKIVVRQDAQKTDARQTNNNLVLSDGALINTKPQLEIRADDVKCAHAATIGRLDEASLFYLRTRGLTHEAARGLLVRAFAGEVVGRLGIEPLRIEVERAVSAALGSRIWDGEAA